jgi:hypothetical protein
VTKREELEAALAKAEAALAKAVINAGKVDSDRAEANAKLDNARAHCRRAHMALIELDDSELIAWSRKWINTPIKQSGKDSKRSASASPPSRPSSEHPVHGENKRSQDESGPRKAIHRINVGFSAREPKPGDARARPSLLRQTVGLFALILTYVLYFHVDVQLQIVSLPSIFVWTLQ